MLVRYTGTADRREIARKDLRVHEESSDVLVWDSPTATMELDEAEWETLCNAGHRHEFEVVEPASDASTSDSSTDQVSQPDGPQAASGASSRKGKPTSA